MNDLRPDRSEASVVSGLDSKLTATACGEAPSILTRATGSSLDGMYQEVAPHVFCRTTDQGTRHCVLSAEKTWELLRENLRRTA